MINMIVLEFDWNLNINLKCELNQLVRFWYLSFISPEPLLLAYGKARVKCLGI